jgi:transposase InsO family protein
VRDDRDLNVERQRLAVLIDRFQSGGPDKCTKHPHSFFGIMTPEEWSALNYIHLDHHLKQFGV